MTREELKAMPERTEIFRRGYGASVTKEEFSCWEDASIEVTYGPLMHMNL